MWHVEILRDGEWVRTFSSLWKEVALQEAGHELQRGEIVRLRGGG